MKKLIGVLVVLGRIRGGRWSAYHYFYGGEAYYTKITTNGEMSATQADSGEKFTTYTYKQAAYNKDGEKKQVTLREEREHPLKMNAYLKLKVNPRKGVLSWEEIKASEVPKNAAEKIDQ